MAFRTTELRVDHCPECGKIYQKNAKGMCDACYQEIDRHLQLCLDHLKRHRDSDTDSLIAATKVPARRIIKFITERKLFVRDYPNLTYPCELCRSPIREHKLCVACMTGIKHDIEEMYKKDEKLAEWRRTERLATSYRMYDPDK